MTDSNKVNTTRSDAVPPASSQATAAPYRRDIFLVCATTFFFWAGLYLYVPILSVYAKSIGASLSMVGAVAAAYAIPQFAFRIPIGIWFDRIAKRKILLSTGIVAASIGALGLRLAVDPWGLFFARAVTGVGAAMWVTFTVYFTGYYPAGDSRRAISIISFAQGIALVAGSLCGGLIAQYGGYGNTFLAGVILEILALITLLFTREPARPIIEPTSWARIKRVFTYPPLIMASITGILVQFVNTASTMSFVSVYAAQIGGSSADLGTINMLALFASAVMALLTVRISHWRSTSFVVLLGGLLSGCAVLSIPFVQSIHVLGGMMFINGMGKGLLQTMLMAISIQGIPQQQRATAMGVFQATYAVGMFLGPLISGALADSRGLASVFYLSAALSVVIAATAYIPIKAKPADTQ